MGAGHWEGKGMGQWKEGDVDLGDGSIRQLYIFITGN
jgi:hypothetical protein